MKTVKYFVKLSKSCQSQSALKEWSNHTIKIQILKYRKGEQEEQRPQINVREKFTTETFSGLQSRVFSALQGAPDCKALRHWLVYFQTFST